MALCCRASGNVGSWLVAKVAIVAIFSKLFWNSCIVWRVRFCGKTKLGEPLFLKKTVIAERQFFLKNAVAQSSFCSSPYLNRFVCWVHYCSKLCQSSPWKPRREASHFQNCQIQTPSLSQKNQSLIKPLLKNSFSTIFQGPGPGEAPFHFSRFVCWVHYCSKLCQSSSWKPRREASLFQRQLPNSNSKPFPKEPIPY